MNTTPVARLTLATDAEYAKFAALQVKEYARQLVRAGEVAAENGAATASERLQDLLADRLRSVGHTFFVATPAHENVRIGWIWLSPAPEFIGSGRDHTRWLSQLTVEELHRGRGWGRAILVATEDHCVSIGVEWIWLRVFNWNQVARRLYTSHGYELATQFSTDAHLRKILVGTRRPTPA